MVDPTSIVAGLVMISFLVVIHEWGHYIVAKIFGIGVPIFSVGMGPRLFGIEVGGTDYRVSALPVGGFVMLEGSDAFGEEDVHASVDPQQSFMNRPVWQRLAVMAAGPAVNIVLPLFMFTVALMAGQPRLASTVETILPDSDAEAAGFLPGDRIVAVEGEPTVIFDDVVDALMPFAGGQGDISVSVDRGGEVLELALSSDHLTLAEEGHLRVSATGLGAFVISQQIGVEDPASPAGQAGLLTGDWVVSVDGEAVSDWYTLDAALTAAPHTVVVRRFEEGADEPVERTLQLHAPLGWTAPERFWTNGVGVAPALLFAQSVNEGSAAEEAGVLPGDRFLSVDGTPVRSFAHFIELVKDTTDGGAEPRALDLVVIRDGQPVQMSMTPTVQVVEGETYARPLIGVQRYWDAIGEADLAVKHHSLFEALPRAYDQWVAIIERTVLTLGNMFAGRVDPAKNVGGPVAMFVTAGQGAQGGIFAFATLASMFSISVGIINLLPVPALDGGQIAILLAEAIKGRPLSLAVRERLQMAGVLMLLAVMVLVTINDVSRWI